MSRAAMTLCAGAVKDHLAALFELVQFRIRIRERSTPDRIASQALDSRRREQRLLEGGEVIKHAGGGSTVTCA